MAETAEPPLSQEEVVPPVGEEVHLPEPTFLPALLALFITIALVGVVISWYVFGLGMLFTVVVIARWVREARAEMSHLPLEH